MKNITYILVHVCKCFQAFCLVRDNLSIVLSHFMAQIHEITEYENNLQNNVKDLLQ